MLATPRRGARQLRPRVRNIGVAQSLAAVALLAVLCFGSATSCGSDGAQLIPAGIELSLLIAVSATAMMARLPRTSAIAPALSVGAALPLLSGAASGWAQVWSGCSATMLDQDLVALVIVPAASFAVLATSVWLLLSRDEIEPWYGARGVVVSTAAALTVLLIGLAFTMLLHADDGLATATAAVTLPWAVAVMGTGWLRSSPAIALVTPAASQAIWLLIY